MTPWGTAVTYGYLKAIQAQVGHSTAGMTLDTYGHLLPGGQKEAAARMNQILAALKRRPE